MIIAPQTTLMNPGMPQATAMPPAPQQMPQPNEHQQRHETIAKLAPLAGLAGLFLKGSGGLAGLAGELNEGTLKGAAGGVAANVMENQAKGTINPTLASHLVNLGFDDFNKVPQAADVAIPAINNNMQTALGNAGGVVDMNGFRQQASDLIDKELTISEPVRQKMLGWMDKLNVTPAAVMGEQGQSNRNAALKELRVLESAKAKANTAWQTSIRSGKPDEEQHSAYSVLRSVTDELKNRTFSDEKGTPLALDDMTKGQMISQLEPLKNALPDVYNNMAGQIRGTKSLVDARHLMADLTEGSISHSKMAYKGGGLGGSVNDLAHGPLGIPAAVFAGTKSPLDALAAALGQSHGVQVGLTSMARKLAK